MFHGSYVALITPFRDDQVDEMALRKLVNWHIQQGSNGLVPMGTTGESPCVSESEHKQVVRIVVEETAGRIPVIAGAGSNYPQEAVAYAQYAQSVGANGVLCVAGYYNRPAQEGLYQHFKQVHDAIDIPMVIYNIPPRAIVDVLPDTMARLAKLPRVVGVKDATCDLARISQERVRIHKPFSYFSGEDMTAVAYNASGGIGCISVTANVAPALCAKMQLACSEGDYAKALELHDQLAPLHNALFAEPSPAAAKYAASLLGLCHEGCRLPIVSLSVKNKTVLEKVLVQLDLV